MPTELLILAIVIILVALTGAYLTGFAKGFAECVRDISEENENPYLRNELAKGKE